MRLRWQTAEHPFGTLKSWMGATHFLTRTLAHVRTEISLHVLGYNIKRVTNLIGVIPLIEAEWARFVAPFRRMTPPQALCSSPKPEPDR
mgnify:CR=1 FL=1